MVVGHSVNVLMKEAVIGSGLGLVSAIIWYLTIQMPTANKMLAAPGSKK